MPAGRVTTKDLFQLVDEQITKRVGFNGLNPRLQQLSHSDIAPLAIGQGSATNSVLIADLVAAIQEMLRQTIPPTIIEGLQVTATTPSSGFIQIAAGKGAIGGRIFELEADAEMAIPFDVDTTVFYVTLHLDHIAIEPNEHDEKLTIAKIIVPQPGVTMFVVDKKPDDGSPDAYIINMRGLVLHEDGNGNLEEDSIDFLRDNISPILADNLIGNIRLSEDLKIINTQGTLELDSKEMRLLNADAVVMAKFTRRGVFFYDTAGRESARFSVDDARLGNILITPNSLQSLNFTSGAFGAGFQINDTGDAEFNNIYARGKISTTVFEKLSVSVIGGNFAVLDGDTLDEDMTSLDSSTLTIEGDSTFAVGDVLRMKQELDDEWFVITARNGNTYTVTRDRASQYAANSNPAWTKGTAVVNYGQSGEGGLYMTASESNAPYMSVFTHAGSPWSTITTHMRFGNLNGYLGYVDDTFGIAIGNSTQFLKYDPVNGLRIQGNVTITGGNAAVVYYQDAEPGSSGDANDPNEGDFWIDTNDDNALYSYQSGVWELVSPGTASTGINTYRQSSIPTATRAGEIWHDTDDNKLYRAAATGANEIAIGEWEQLTPVGMNSSGDVITRVIPGTNVATPSGAGLFLGADKLGYYSGSAWKVYIENTGQFKFEGDSGNRLFWDGATLTIRGTLNADDIDAGTISADRIAAGSIAASKLSVSTLSAITADLGTITAGTVTGSTLRTASSGRRVQMDVNGIVGYDASDNKRFGFLVGAISGFGDAGDFIVGNVAANKYIKWDESDAILTVRGTIHADDIAAESITSGKIKNGGLGFGGANYYTTAGSSTFTVPDGVTKVWVRCWGAGGGGGTSESSDLANLNDGGDGGSSSFGSSVIAGGGGGGETATAASVPGAGGAAGVATAGDIQISGAEGAGGIKGAFADPSLNVGGDGGQGANGGQGGRGGFEPHTGQYTNATSGKLYGGGGGGGGDGSGTRAGGGGGGGGAYAESVVTVTPGAGITVTVGAAGAASTPGANAGGGAAGSVGLVIVYY